MRFIFAKGIALLSLGVFALVLSGCGQEKRQDAKGKPSRVDPAKHRDKKDEAKPGHDWWCDEHGVPEAECSMCDPKVAAAFKKKGDWCEKHDRARSQCFICDPKLQEKYAAIYRAKCGKEPPEPTDNLPPKKEDKK